MDQVEVAELASGCHRALEPLHAMIYFAPEADERYMRIGLRKGRMGYFASRAAPMGAVGQGTVTATFYNFSPDLVSKHIPAAWEAAAPERIIEARFAAADAALRRLLGAELVNSPELAEAAELATEATRACTPEGRPLYAAHADLVWPKQPHVALWHAIALLREYRGDGHIAALVGNGLSGLGALITHTATGKGFQAEAARTLRGWSEQEWAHTVERLADDGIVDRGCDGEAEASLTEHGAELRARIEHATNVSASQPYLAIGTTKSNRLREIGKALSKSVVANGAFPPGIFAGR